MEEWECSICGHINWIDKDGNYICVNCLHNNNNNNISTS